MLTIVKAPHPVLARTADKVSKIDASIRKLVTDMTVTLDTTRDPEGVGLAAPQVGVSKQLFIIRQTKKSPLLVFINPVLEKTISETEAVEVKPKKKKKGDVKLEGCLSLNNIWGVVHRTDSIMLSYMDEKGVYHKRLFSGFLATIIQHEVDHLHGILFPKRVLEQGEKLYKQTVNEAGETIFEEIDIV
jgi:peptide deformylase